MMEGAFEFLRRSLPDPGPAPERVWTRLQESVRRRPRWFLALRAAAFLVGFAATFLGLGRMTREPSALARELVPVATSAPDQRTDPELRVSVELLVLE